VQGETQGKRETGEKEATHFLKGIALTMTVPPQTITKKNKHGNSNNRHFFEFVPVIAQYSTIQEHPPVAIPVFKIANRSLVNPY
jgi:hypothetical protein